MVRSVLIWRLLLACGIFFFIGWVVNEHIPFSGVKKAVTDFSRPGGTISFVYPVSRIHDGEMVEDPLYGDVHTLVPYTRATADLVYSNTTDIPLRMGIKQEGESGRTIVLKEFETEKWEGEWRRAVVSFDLNGASYYNNKYTLVFSAPGLVTEKDIPGEIHLAKLTLTLAREPFSWNDVVRLWRE